MEKTTEELQAAFDKAYVAFSSRTGIIIDEEMRQRYKTAIGFMRDYALDAIVDLNFPMEDIDKLNALLPLFALTDNSVGDLQFIAQMAQARWAVDIVVFGINQPDKGDFRGLTVDQLAFLSGLRPQTVRNMQVKDNDGKPKHSDGLRTVAIDGQTLVDAETACKWLEGKQGYKKTVRTTAKSKGRDWAKTPLFDLVDLGKYLRDIRRDCKPESLVGKPGSDADLADLGKLCEKLDLTDEWAEILEKLEKGDCPQLSKEFTHAMEGLFVCWADEHKLDAEAFVFAVLALHEKLHRIKVKERVQYNHSFYRVNVPDRLPTRPCKTISMDEVLRHIENNK